MPLSLNEVIDLMNKSGHCTTDRNIIEAEYRSEFNGWETYSVWYENPETGEPEYDNYYIGFLGGKHVALDRRVQELKYMNRGSAVEEM